EATRRDWHYVPRSRPGLCLADMDARQQKAAYELLSTGLSTDAYAVACLVVALEDVLDLAEGGRGPRRRTQREWGRHRAEYHVAFFGEPRDDTWGWRFEGHHVSATVTVVDGTLAATPQFLGANPAEVAAIRVLPREDDLAFALLDAMTTAQRRRALVAEVAPDDILTTNVPALDREGLLPPEEGVALRDLSGDAATIAERLAGVYARRCPEPAPIDLDALHFAFAGEPVHRRPHYYRLQGGGLLVEYDNTQNDANHVHTVVRHVHGDFGDDLLARHRLRHHGDDRDSDEPPAS
ncbi:MAG TPA: DUF3500 domain-containing protein, partial [Acidimicrobiales bacterium]